MSSTFSKTLADISLAREEAAWARRAEDQRTQAIELAVLFARNRDYVPSDMPGVAEIFLDYIVGQPALSAEDEEIPF